MNAFEAGLYDLASLFLMPILVLIVASLGYAFFSLGGFAMEAVQRLRRTRPPKLAAYHAAHGGTSDDLELWIMKQLEWLRIVARSAPMLGLVATMIPMGPALLALSRNDGEVLGQNLVVAFAAVILALISAAIAFFILTIRRRWLLEDLRQIERAAAVGAE